MKVYLYSENFDTKNFDFAVYEDGNLRFLCDKTLQDALKTASEIECSCDIDAQTGFAMKLVSRGLAWVSFKILVNETSPSGRGRLIFGHSGRIWLTENISPENIVSAINAFTAEKSLSIPDIRMSAFCEKLKEKLYARIHFKRADRNRSN